MKRLYPTILCVLIASLGYLNAQISGDFESWGTDTQGNGALPGQYSRPGTQPSGWEASNVHQKFMAMTIEEVLITSDAGRDGGNSVRMENKFVGAGSIGSNAPAYITLGLPWTYPHLQIAKSDGGTVGGVSYYERPDSIVGYFKRSLGEDKAEDALILAYLWSGTATSTVTTKDNGNVMSKDTTVQVTDQDRSVLGSTDGANLIGKAEYRISGNLDEWTRIAIPFEYYSSSNPQKLNVIISSANYFDRGAIGKGNILWADDVELVFAGRTEITIPEMPYDCFYGRAIEFRPTSNDTETEIKISIADPSVVSIEDGIMKFLKLGTTTVKVSQAASDSFKGAEITIPVTVVPAPLTIRLEDITTEPDTEPVYSFIYTGLSDADYDIVQTNPEQIFSTLPMAKAYTEDGKEVTFPAQPGTYTIKWLQEPEADNYNITVDNTEKVLTVSHGVTINPIIEEGSNEDISEAVNTEVIWGDETEEGRKLSLKITVSEGYSLSDLVVKANDEVVYPKPAVLKNDTPNEVLVELGYIKENVTIKIEGIKRTNSTGITDVINQDIEVYTHPGQLQVKSSKQSSLAIYTLSGETYLQRKIDTGTTTIALPKGLYIVKVDNIVKKVVIR